MGNSFIYRWKERSLEKRIALMKRHAEYKPLEDIRTCLLFATTDGEERKAVEYLRGALHGVQVETLYFAEGKTEAPETDGAVWLRSGDLGFGANIRNEGVAALWGKRYDLVADVTQAATPLANYTLMRMDASFIAGRKKEGGTADLVIGEAEGAQEFAARLMEVLTQIKKY